MTVEREVATNEDLSDLAGAVGAEVLDEMDEALRDHHRTAPCKVTVEVDAEVVDEEDEPTTTAETEVRP